jgi:hypothetical protein
MKFVIILLMTISVFVNVAYAEADGTLRAPMDDTKDADYIGIAHTKKHKLQYIMRDCPVVGNTTSGIYHMPGQPNYKQMLIVNKCATKGSCKDNRRCFDDEAEAIATQFCSKKGGCRPYKKSNAVLK